MDNISENSSSAAVCMALQPQHEALLARVLELAKKHGSDAAEAAIDSGTGLSVTVRMGQVDKIEHEKDRSLSMTVYIGKRKGSTSTSDLSPSALETSVALACDIARHTSQDEHAGLAEARFMAKELPELDLYHPWECTPAQAIELGVACEQHALEQDRRIDNSDGAMLSTWSGLHVYGNSHGFIGGWPSSSHSLGCTILATDAQGNKQQGGWYSRATDWRALEDVSAIGKEAGRRCASRLGARRLSTRQTPVLFEAPVASGLFADFVGAISGTSQYRRASFLLDQQGHAVFPEYLRISEQPHLAKAEGSAPFDKDGVATQTRDLIHAGVLQGYVLSAYSAHKLGLSPTGNGDGVHNLTIHPSGGDLTALLREMDTGLLVTELMGFGTNQLTGDYSRGVAGFWVEGGELAYPVEEITVAGNLREVYQHIIATGADIDQRGNILTGSILVENMTVAGE